jgi:Fe-S cluster biogenesis protein NfuA
MTDADRIALCEHGKYRDRCLSCIVDEGTLTAADRIIAQLESELAEARENERRIDREREALCQSLDAERAAHERTRDELKRMQEREAHFAKALAVADGGQYRADWDGAISRLIAERDAALAKAAAMLDVLRVLHHQDSCILRENRGACLTCRAMTGTAGRAIAERVKLLKEVADAVASFIEARADDNESFMKLKQAYAAYTALLNDE